MKLATAKDMIGNPVTPGFMVRFHKYEGGGMISDNFPDKHAGEELIETEEEAWELARQSAAATRQSEYGGIYVIDGDFRPVKDYKSKKIK